MVTTKYYTVVRDRRDTMTQKTQLLKGLLEGCILKIVSSKETYGYAICEELNSNDFDAINEGTVYPILTRLEKKELIYSVKKVSPLGPKRKYYFITEAGQIYLNDFLEEWEGMKLKVDKILMEVHHEE